MKHATYPTPSRLPAALDRPAPTAAAAVPAWPLLRCLLAGLAVGLLVYPLEAAWLARGWYAHDFTWPWAAARLLLSGADPYTLHLNDAVAWRDPFYYPLPAALLAVPLASLSAEAAGALWAALGAAVLTAGVLRRAPHLWPVLLSAPALIGVRNAQWAPLLVGAALLYPPLLGLAAAKPTLGLVLWLHRPSWRAAPLGLALLALAWWARPDWLAGWLASAAHAPHAVPLLQPGGWLLGLALLRWRDPRARLLLGLALVPQILYFYDQLPLGLVASTRRQALALALLSWLAYAVGPHGPPIVALVYLPALACLLASSCRRG